MFLCERRHSSVMYVHTLAKSNKVAGTLHSSNNGKGGAVRRERFKLLDSCL